MKNKEFIDKNKSKLIIKNRKSAVFFYSECDNLKKNSYGEKHEKYIDIKELKKNFVFSKVDLVEIINYLKKIGKDSWENFSPNECNNTGEEYDDWYSKEFDNNGSCNFYKGNLNLQGPYTQLKENGKEIILIKFNKKTFQSFVYDFEKLIK